MVYELPFQPFPA
ncbi:unnamed protein product, partial [Didymodactylos carnosus]